MVAVLMLHFVHFVGLRLVLWPLAAVAGEEETLCVAVALLDQRFAATIKMARNCYFIALYTLTLRRVIPSCLRAVVIFLSLYASVVRW